MLLAAVVDPAFGTNPYDGPGGPNVEAKQSVDQLGDGQVDIVVDFTKAEAAVQNVAWALEHDVAAVVGTSGITSRALEDIERACSEKGGHVLIAPNFAIGAVLAMKFAEIAAAWLPQAEIIELHHAGKLDSPSGTALQTVDRILKGRQERSAETGTNAPGGTPGGGVPTETLPGARGAEKAGVHVHSVRLPGLVAHQEVIFGGPGQTLSVRHDSLDRTSFMPGVLMAIRQVRNRPGLTLGLEGLLGL